MLLVLGACVSSVPVLAPALMLELVVVATIVLGVLFFDWLS